MMVIFKVVNSERTIRKSLKAGSWTEFIQNGCAKLGIAYTEHDEVKVFIEKDGCQVEEEEVLLELSNRDITFLLTTSSWRDSPSPVVPAMLASCSSSPVVSAVLASSSSEEGFIDLSDSRNSSSSNMSNGSFNFQVQVPFPKLSTFVLSCLKANKVLNCWPQLINETAFFYLNEVPISSSAEYQSVGQQMYSKYPCIAFPGGTEPWSHFTDRLSAKIRNERYKRSKKSVMTPYPQSTSRKFVMKKSIPKCSIEEGTLLSEDDLQKHIGEMQDEMKKGRPNDTHIKTLIRETFKNRREWLKTLPASEVGSIVSRFPCFGDMKYVKEEYQIMKKKESLDVEHQNMEKLFEAGGKLLKQDDATDIDVMEYLEKAIAFDKGKGKKTQSIVTIKKGIATVDIEKSSVLRY